MPMYYPDLQSVKRDAEMMAKQSDPTKRYKGIIPQTDEELLEARLQLAKYFRDIWHDEIQAIEIEYAVTEENYYEKIGEAVRKQFLT